MNMFIVLASSVLFVNAIRDMYRDGKKWSTRFMSIFQIVLAISLLSLLRGG